MIRLPMMNVSVMGVPIPEEELPQSDAVELRDHFAKVTLSPAAIDRASQVVPEHIWQAVGIHTWLSGRATEAFLSLKSVNDREAVIGRLKYVFEFESHGPELKKVVFQ